MANPYISDDLVQAQSEYDPTTNEEFESSYTVIRQRVAAQIARRSANRKSTKKKAQRSKSTTFDNDRNYRNVWEIASYSDDDEVEGDDDNDDMSNRELRGNSDNTEKLIAKFLRDLKEMLKIDIPNFINLLCFEHLFEPTNVIFKEYDSRIRGYIHITKDGKRIDMDSRTVFIFSEDGYSSGHHIWHVKCLRVHNCQALGICQFKDPKYRYGDNIFDTALNDQLGDRYIYAGDRGHSWRGSQELRPYVCCVYDTQLFYHRMTRSKLSNSRWEVGDIITVDLNLGNGLNDNNKYVVFLKNGKALCEPLKIVKHCKYYPVFQVYQRGTFEIIDDISKEPIYQPDDQSDDDDEQRVSGQDEDNVLSSVSVTSPVSITRHKSLDSEDESDEQ